MAGFSTQDSSSTGNSTSTSTPVQTPQSQWGLQLSQLLNMLGNTQYNWAMDQFNRGQQITDQNVNNFMKLSGDASGLADGIIKQYSDTFAPLMESYVNDANSYGSEARQRFMAGQAESTVGQANQQAKDELERKLQGFGINPNSGRYQDMLTSSRIADAAARAGAGTKAAMDTEAIGRGMKEKAIGFGQNLPGMGVNALQSAMSGVSAAENSILGMLNTGAGLSNTVAPLMNAASGAIKMPSQAQNSQSNQKSTSTGRSSQTDPSKSDSGGKGGQPKQDSSGQSGRGPQQGSSPSDHTGAGPTVTKGPFPADVQKLPNSGGTGDKVDNPYQNDDGVQQPYFSPDLARDANGVLKLPGSDFDTAPKVDNWQYQNPPNFDPNNMGPNAAGAGGQSFTPQDWINQGPQSPQPQNPAQPFDPYQNDPNGFNQQPAPQQDFAPSDWNQPQQPFQQFDPSQWDQPQENYDPYQDMQPGDYGGDNGGDNSSDYGDQPDYNYDSGNDYSYGDESGGQQDYGGDYSGGYDEEYARGGQVRPRGVLPTGRGRGPTTGGPVPMSASPSRGQQVDDVPARLNAKEFVIPRDVAEHKGTEFFHKLIAQSRKARTGMAGPPAQPKMRQALPGGRPSFVSRPMGA